jgi:diadenosine tetraphosphate (Ap4A) HIT family hydrolase
MDCALCLPPDADDVWAGERWRVLVDRDQQTLGTCLIALKRHDEDIGNLSDDEVRDLWDTIRNTRDVLAARFRPDRFEYAFLADHGRHVHLHVVPRYDGPRDFAGNELAAPDAQPAPAPVSKRRLPDHVYEEIVTAIREGFTGNYI